MKKFAIIILLSSFTTLFAQNQVLNGTITIQNSSRKPVRQAIVSAKNALAVQTNDFGTFTLKFNKVTVGEEILLTIDKKDFEVVNKTALRIKFASGLNIKIYMNKKDAVDSVSQKYTIIIKKNISDKYEMLKKAYTQAQDQSGAAKLETRKNIALTLTPDIAKRLAETNNDEMSDYYSKSMEYFVEGDVKAAGEVLEDVNLQEALQRGKDTKTETNILKALENYMLKARLMVIDLDFDNADELYEVAASPESATYQNMNEYADFLHQINKNSTAELMYKQAVSNAKISTVRGELLLNMGNFLQARKQYTSAEQAFDDAYKIYERLDFEMPNTYNFDMCASLLSKLILYQDILENAPKKSYYDAGMKLFEKIDDIIKKNSSNPSAATYQATTDNLKEAFKQISIDNIIVREKANNYKMLADKEIENKDSIKVAKFNYLQSIKIYESILSKENNAKYYQPLAKGYEALNKIETDNLARISNEERVLKLYEDLYQTDTENSDYKNYLANAYNQMSWYLVVARQYKFAKFNALKAVVTDPMQETLNSVLALTYILTNEYDKASAIYTEYKNKQYYDTTLREIFLITISDAEKEGINHADFPKAKLALKE